MAEFPALPLFTDAFIGDTLHLTTEQIGAYMLLLMTAWRTKDCSLPDDDKYLARVCRMDTKAWGKNRDVLRQFWKRNENGKLVQGRLSDERKFVSDQSKKQSQNSKARWLKDKETGHATAMPNRCQTDAPTPTPTPTPIKESKESNGQILFKSDPSGQDDFINFWKIYPRKVSKADAEKAFKKALATATSVLILEKTKKYAESVAGKDQKYIPHASTWLNGRRWEDEPVALSQKSDYVGMV